MLQCGLNLGSLLFSETEETKAPLKDLKLFSTSQLFWGKIWIQAFGFHTFQNQRIKLFLNDEGSVKAARKLCRVLSSRTTRGHSLLEPAEVSQPRFPIPQGCESAQHRTQRELKDTELLYPEMWSAEGSSECHLCVFLPSALNFSNLLCRNEQHHCHCFPVGSGDMETLLALPKILIVA